MNNLQQPYHYQRTGVKIVVLCPGLSGSYVKDDLNTLNNNSMSVEPGRVTIQLQKYLNIIIES